MSGQEWAFLTSHSRVLVCLMRNPRMTMQEVAVRTGMSSRAVQRIIDDLVIEGVVTKDRQGRTNYYEVTQSDLARHPLESDLRVFALVQMVACGHIKSDGPLA